MAFDFKALRRDIEVLIDDMLSEEAQRQFFIAIAEDEVAAFENAWREALANRGLEAEILVDGKSGAAIDQVSFPGGVILARVKPVADLVNEALTQLNALVKIKSGRYKRSLAVYANQRRIQRGEEATPADMVAITYLAPYARKAEQREFNIKDGAALGGGLLFTVTKLLKKKFQAAALKIRFNYANFAEAEIEPRNFDKASLEHRRATGGRRRAGPPPEPNRLPAIFIN
jgi:hypothetical protein